MSTTRSEVPFDSGEMVTTEPGDGLAMDEARCRAAYAAGDEAAGDRLAQLLECRGYELLHIGDPHGAQRLLAEAASLVPDAEYHQLHLIASLVTGDSGSVEAALRALEAVPDDLRPAAADFWMGTARLAIGDPPAAVAALRRAVHGVSTDGSTADAARLLLALLNDDEPGIADAARGLLRRHGRDWAWFCPVTPDTLIAAAARTDAAPLDGLVHYLPVGSELSEKTRQEAARGLIARAAVAAAEGRLDAARAGLRLARRLMGED
ncbi:hypothetical protein OHR68_41760 [Spirillospora sp. NBC_00431]